MAGKLSLLTLLTGGKASGKHKTKGKVPPAVMESNSSALSGGAAASRDDAVSPVAKKSAGPAPGQDGWVANGKGVEERDHTSYDGEDEDAEYEAEEEEEEGEERGSNVMEDGRSSEAPPRPTGEAPFLMEAHASIYYESPARRASDGSQSSYSSSSEDDDVADKGHVSDPGAYAREDGGSFSGSPLHPAALHRMLDDQSKRQSERSSGGRGGSHGRPTAAAEQTSDRPQHLSSSEVEGLEMLSRGEESDSNRTNGSLSGTRSLVPYVGEPPSAAAATSTGFEFQCPDMAGGRVSPFAESRAYLPAHLWDMWGLSTRDGAASVDGASPRGAIAEPARIVSIASLPLGDASAAGPGGLGPWLPSILHRSTSSDAIVDSQSRGKGAFKEQQPLMLKPPKARSVVAPDEPLLGHQPEPDALPPGGVMDRAPSPLLLKNSPHNSPQLAKWHGPTVAEGDAHVGAGRGAEQQDDIEATSGEDGIRGKEGGPQPHGSALNWVDQWVNSIDLDDLPAAEEWEVPTNDEDIDSVAAPGAELLPPGSRTLLRSGPPNRGASSGHLATLDGAPPGGPVDADLEQAAALARSLDRTVSAAHFPGRGLRVVPPLASFHLLKSLDLSRNNIVRVAAGTLPKSLHVLDLSHNRLSAIEGVRDLTRLRALNLSNNRITRIGHGLASCSALRELYLAANKISEVEGLHRLLKLAVLDLSHNKLTSNKALGQLAANYASMQALNLTGNPIHANLGDSAIRRYITSLLPHLIYLNRQPLKPLSAREAAKDSVTRAALGAPGHHSSRALGASSHHGGSARSVKAGGGGGGGGGKEAHRGRHATSAASTRKPSSSSAAAAAASSSSSAARKAADPRRPGSSRSSQRSHRKEVPGSAR